VALLSGGGWSTSRPNFYSREGTTMSIGVHWTGGCVGRGAGLGGLEQDRSLASARVRTPDLAACMQVCRRSGAVRGSVMAARCDDWYCWC